MEFGSIKIDANAINALAALVTAVSAVLAILKGVNMRAQAKQNPPSVKENGNEGQTQVPGP